MYSTKPLARVNCVRYESGSFPDGVVAIVSYKDIPHGGKNIGAQTIFGIDSLFADELTRCAGERIALVVSQASCLGFFFSWSYFTFNLKFRGILSLKSIIGCRFAEACRHCS